MSGPPERLYALLPAVYRLRDAELGSPLRALLGVIEEELARVEDNIEELGESWFIETCPEWVVPYIGAVVGNRPLIDVTHSRRADVAKTIYYRRRKGTLPMLEELARDVTGWGAHAVEMMELLAWTQNLNHLRYALSPDPDVRRPFAVDRVGTVNVRNVEALERLAGPFDLAAHTVDVRAAPRGMATTDRPSQVQGLYGTRKVGFFLWRLESFPLDRVPARPAGAVNPHGWRFNPSGADTHLFTDTRGERDPARLAREVHVPGPIRPLAFRADLAAYRERYLPLPPDDRPVDTDEWYGPNRSIHILADGEPVPPAEIQCKELATRGDGTWPAPPAGMVAVDVRRGRLAFALGEEPTTVEVRFAYGFSAAMGGGPYDRRSSMAEVSDGVWFQPVGKGTAVDTIQLALAAWVAAGSPDGVIEIADSDIYGGLIAIDLPAGVSLVIQAAEEQLPSVRLVGDLVVGSPADAETRLTLNGLLIEGAIEIGGNLTLEIVHCTLVPGRMLDENGEPWFDDRDSVVVTPGAQQTPAVTILSSILGPIRLPATSRGLVLRDSIVQSFPVDGEVRPAIAATDPADEPGPPAVIERSTIFGPVHLRELTLASEVIFTETLTVQRRQVGCVRFSYAPSGSRTPRRFQCQPDLALQDVAELAERDRIEGRLAPLFTSERYGDPAYAQLTLACAAEIRTGAENGSEMGAFSSLMQPQREANLRTRLDEYLPFGLEAGLIYVT